MLVRTDAWVAKRLVEWLENEMPALVAKAVASVAPEATGTVEAYQVRRVAGGAVRFVLRPTGEAFCRVSASGSGRRVWAVCWHGHALALRLLFDAFPQAVVKTALTTYRGHHDYVRLAGRTAYRQVGSVLRPCYYAEACECDDCLIDLAYQAIERPGQRCRRCGGALWGGVIYPIHYPWEGCEVMRYGVL